MSENTQMEIEEETKEPSQPQEDTSEPSHLIPEEIKYVIVLKKKDGYSNKLTAKFITLQYKRPCSHQTVKRIWEKYQEKSTVDNLWSPLGRPHVLSTENLDQLRESVIADRYSSVNTRMGDLEINACRGTVNLALIDLGYRAYRVKKKPFLTPDNINQRLNFARSHRTWTMKWRTMVFSDEASFMVVSADGRTWVRRTPEEAEDEISYQSYDSYSDTVLVWGAISYENGVGPLVRATVPRIKAPNYLSLFRFRLKRYYPGLYNGTLTFIQDNAPPHRAVITQDWFDSKGNNFLYL